MLLLLLLLLFLLLLLLLRPALTGLLSLLRACRGLTSLLLRACLASDRALGGTASGLPCLSFVLLLLLLLPFMKAEGFVLLFLLLTPGRPLLSLPLLTPLLLLLLPLLPDCARMVEGAGLPITNISGPGGSMG